MPDATTRRFSRVEYEYASICTLSAVAVVFPLAALVCRLAITDLLP